MMRVLKWICGHTRKDWIRNEVIQDKVGVTSAVYKMRKTRLKWFKTREKEVYGGIKEV